MDSALLFRFKNAENQYTSHKKYGVHLGLIIEPKWAIGPRVFAVLGLTWHTLRPRYTIYYFDLQAAKIITAKIMLIAV